MKDRTKGPWEVDSIDCEGDYGDSGPDCRTGYKAFAVFDEHGRVLFDSLNRDTRVSCIHEETDDERHYAWDQPARADLTLAAAAPDLLAACEAVKRGDATAMDLVHAAIAKANKP